jgi:hypothetical protein
MESFIHLMCKDCGNCSKEHNYDALAEVDFVEASIFI